MNKKNFPCNEFDYTATERGGLQKHQKNKHNKKGSVNKVEMQEFDKEKFYAEVVAKFQKQQDNLSAS